MQNLRTQAIVSVAEQVCFKAPFKHVNNNWYTLSLQIFKSLASLCS